MTDRELRRLSRKELIEIIYEMKKSELALKERMLPLMEGRLVLFATHRLHWLEIMDYVLVVEDGRVVESGRPGERRAANGALSSLVKQMRGGDFL